MSRTPLDIGFVVIGFAIFGLGCSQACGEIIGPYTADSDTLHLWHLDENTGPSAPASGVSGSFDLSPVSGTSLGNSAFSGFGSSAGSFGDLNGGSITSGSVTGTGGAFTMEALVNLNNISANQMILAADSSSGAPAQRLFQFRVNSGNLEFISISPTEVLSVAIPTAGEDAFVANEWFHAAVSYDGNEGAPDNLKLYWTRLDQSRTEANLISTALQMTSDLTGTGMPTFNVGSRLGERETLNGFIDEVRISGIARNSSDFLFAVPEPSSIWTVSLVVGLATRYRRRRA